MIGIVKIFMTCGCSNELNAKGVVKPKTPKVNDDRRFFVKTDPRKCILNALKKIAIIPIIVIKPKFVIEVIFPKAKTIKASSGLN